ncbi:MAG: DUF547 domain-containing protein [Pontixanthobacter sp.]
MKITAMAVALSVSTPVFAQETATSPAVTKLSLANAKFARFVPKANPNQTHIDYAAWDEALKYFVFRMGKSIRESSPRPEPGMATRRVYGHDSRYRLEGNRVIFSFLEPEIIEAISEYRKDLENTADQVEISSLSRNEQLAFWINLHNAAVIEQIALAYPVSQPRSIKIGDSTAPFDETPFITVNNVKMSPKDIRTNIVFQNWNDPRIMFAFFRGEIGGPSIQGEAFDSRSTSGLLEKSASEFINSLRGTQKSGSVLHVSEIFEEARPYFFPDWPNDLKAFLLKFSDAEVTKIVTETDTVEADIYEADIADLAKGERDPGYGYVLSDDRMKGSRLNAAVGRLLGEREQKLMKVIRRGNVRGEVTVIDIALPGEPVEPDEIK